MNKTKIVIEEFNEEIKTPLKGNKPESFLDFIEAISSFVIFFYAFLTLARLSCLIPQLFILSVSLYVSWFFTFLVVCDGLMSCKIEGFYKTRFTMKFVYYFSVLILSFVKPSEAWNINITNNNAFKKRFR